jgi:hypothetical protein
MHRGGHLFDRPAFVPAGMRPGEEQRLERCTPVPPIGLNVMTARNGGLALNQAESKPIALDFGLAFDA